jgi:hypothetical protein
LPLLRMLKLCTLLYALRSVKIYIYSCLCELFDLSSKAGSLRGGNEGIEHRDVKASSAGLTLQNKRNRQGKGTSHKNDSRCAPHSIRGRGRERNPVKANRVLLDSEEVSCL